MEYTREVIKGIMNITAKTMEQLPVISQNVPFVVIVRQYAGRMRLLLTKAGKHGTLLKNFAYIVAIV
jgi:hypothetical protein